mgnify:CR=1 FL=1
MRALLTNLSLEAAEVVHLILEAPAEIAQELAGPGARDSLQQYLVQRCDWTIEEVQLAFKEIYHGI